MVRVARNELSAVSLQILLSLVEAPLHGYGIKLDVEARTDGAMSLGSGTLYQALARLEDSEMVEAADPPAGADGRRGRHYRLTDAGQAALERELALLHRTVSSDAARTVLERGAGS